MSRPSTMFATREPDLPAPEVEAAPSILPSGAELLFAQISAAAIKARAACMAMDKAKADRDLAAAKTAAGQFVEAFKCDPKALAKKLAEVLK